MSIRKLGNNKYRVESERTVEGKRYRSSEVVNTKLKGSELKALLNSVESKLFIEIESQIDDPNKLRKLSLGKFYEYFIKNNKVEKTTIAYYNKYVKNRTIDFFGNIPIEDIKKAKVNAFIKYLGKEVSDYTGNYLSPKTIKHYRTTLHAIFQYAYEHDIINHNPVNNVKVNKVANDIKDKYYQPGEVANAITLLKDKSTSERLLMFILVIITGMRPSEMYGLKWSKVNLESGEVIIDKALVYATGFGMVYKNTKDSESRTSLLTDDLISLFKEHKDDERIKLQSLNIYDLDNQFVFTNRKGSHKHEGDFRKFWSKFCKDNNFRYVNPYGLRHTSATLLANSSVSVKAIAEHLGHSNTNTTQVYIHAVENAKEEVKDVLDKNVSLGLRIVK